MRGSYSPIAIVQERETLETRLRSHAPHSSKKNVLAGPVYHFHVTWPG